MNKELSYCIVFLFFITGSCSVKDSQDKKLVAEVGDKKLYLSDISAVIPDMTSRNDSILIAENYIRKWIKQELLVMKAEENLSVEQKNVAPQLIEYRNSLLIFKYKNGLLSQRMDSVVTDEQIEEIYLANPENFNLTTDIVKAVYVKAPADLPQLARLRSEIAHASEAEMYKLKGQYQVFVRNFEIYLDHWVEFKWLAGNVPVNISNVEGLLKQNDFYEYSDFNFYYLIYIKNYKLKSELAPLDFVREKIKNLILNRRKVEFLKQIDENIYNEGVRKGKFKVYNIQDDDKN